MRKKKKAPGHAENRSGGRRSPAPKSLPPDKLAALYAKFNASFSADDLQRYTEVEQGTPLEDVLKELEGVHRQIVEKREK